MRTCSACAQDIAEDAKFCPLCGAQQALEAQVETEVSEELAQPAEPVEEAAPEDQVEEPFVEEAVPAEQTEEAPVEEAAPAEQVGESLVEEPVPAEQAEPLPVEPQQVEGASQQPPYAAAQPQPEPQPQQAYYYAPPQPAYVPPQAQPAYSKGCVAAAMDDVKASGEWIKKSFFLGLLEMVPILNFVVLGYILNWTREVPFGGRTPLPKKVVTGKNFETGFYAFVIALVFGLVIGIGAGLLAFIPLLGWFAGIALSLLCTMFIGLCTLRMAMKDQLGDGFAIGKAWEAMKRNWTALLCAAIVPSLVVGIAASVVWSIAGVLFFGAAIVPLALAGGGSSYALAAAGVALGGLGAIALLAMIYLTCAAGVAANLVTYRAVGHWIGRYAQDWTV